MESQLLPRVIDRIAHFMMCVCYQEGLKQCLAELKKDLPWMERLDMSNPPVEDVLSQVEGKATNVDNGDVNAEDDFQREMHL